MKLEKWATHSINAVDDVSRQRRGLLKAIGLLAPMPMIGVLPSETALARSSGLSDGKSAQAWGDPGTLVSAIAAGTLAVPSVRETVAAYTKGFGYLELEHGRIPKDVADFWGTPAMSGRVFSVVGPSGHQNGLIRVVELGNDFEQVNVYETLGWVALEIRVRSPDVMIEQLRGLPFIHTGGPGDSSTAGGAPSYRAAQFKGPAGEPLYFTQHTQLDSLVPHGTNNVGPLFIQTLAANPYLETRDFYMESLAMKSRMEIDVPRRHLVRKFGLPESSKFKMAAVRAPEFCSIQIDEYPDVVHRRPSADGCLVPGSCMCTLSTDDLDKIETVLMQLNLPYSRIGSYSLLPNTGGRALVCRGCSGEIIEFVQS